MAKTSTNGVHKRTFKTKSGVELVARPISATMLQYLRNSYESKRPEAPFVEVEIAGQTYVQQNPDDPEHKEALARHESIKNEAVAKYVFAQGISNEPPAEFIQHTRRFAPHASAEDMRYLWVTSLLNDDVDEYTSLSEFIMSQTMVTEKGLEKVKEAFPGAD